jgi:Flp pilus assembly protein TadB
MSTGSIVVIAVAAAAVLFLLAIMLYRARAEREIERRRVVGEWDAHREAAESGIAKARELGAEAELHRNKASEHAALADEHAEAASAHAEQAEGFERQISSAGAAATRHEAEAAERERKIG